LPNYNNNNPGSIRLEREISDSVGFLELLGW
jgi:hypothetical protein